MQSDQILHDSMYKGYQIAIYLTGEDDSCDLMVSYADSEVTVPQAIYKVKFVKRDEGVIIAHSFIEGVLYGRKNPNPLI